LPLSVVIKSCHTNRPREPASFISPTSIVEHDRRIAANIQGVQVSGFADMHSGFLNSRRACAARARRARF
jgi:hypothetical protein